MGSSSKPPKPPDTSKYSNEAYSQSQELRRWAQEMWDTGQQEWGKIQQWSQDVMGQMMPAMEDSFTWAKEQRDRYDNLVVPQMQSLFSEAETYASKGEEQRQRAAAIQDTKSAFEAEREANRRRLEGYGVDPSEVRTNALEQQAGIAQAAMSALAANQAGERTKEIGRNLRTQAIATGQNMAAQGMQAGAQGAGYGTGGLQAVTGAGVGGANIASGALPYMGGAGQANVTGAGIVDQAYGRELDYNEAKNAAAQMDFDNMMAVGQSVGQVMPVPGAATGGPVIAPGGPTDDAGAVAISDGEYVIPADVVMKLGTNHFDKMIEKETGRPPPERKQAIPLDPTMGALRSPQRMPDSRAGVIQ